MPTRIAPNNAHQNQRLEYQPGGCVVRSIEGSQKFASGSIREKSNGTNTMTVITRRHKAIAEGLTADIHRIKTIVIPVSARPAPGFRLLNAYINSSEIRP